MTFRALIRWLFLSAAIIVLVVSAPYLYWLGGNEFSHDHQAWASFGSYFGGLLGPVFSLANLVAIAWIGTSIVSRQQELIMRKQLTINLLTEYHEDPMHRTRIALDELISDTQRNSGVLPSLSELERTDPINSPNAFRLYHFFEKWATLADTRNIDNDLLLAALGGRARWWQENFFRPIAIQEKDEDILQSLQQIETHVFSKTRQR